MRTNSNSARLARSLTNGAQYTEAQIASKFGIANPTATIAYLRRNGYSIYSNRKNGDFGKYTKYRMGSARKAVVAAVVNTYGSHAAGLAE